MGGHGHDNHHSHHSNPNAI